MGVYPQKSHRISPKDKKGKENNQFNSFAMVYYKYPITIQAYSSSLSPNVHSIQNIIANTPKKQYLGTEYLLEESK